MSNENPKEPDPADVYAGKRVESRRELPATPQKQLGQPADKTVQQAQKIRMRP